MKRLTGIMMRVAPAGLLLLFGVGLYLMSGHVGDTWDEPTYTRAGDSYVEWIGIALGLIDSPYSLRERFSAPVRDRYWAVTHEHPPLAMVVYGICGRLLDNPRLGAVAFTLLLVAGVYLVCRHKYDRKTALLSVLLLCTMPRLLGHSVVCALDVPVAALSVWTVLCFLRGLERRRWSILFGLVLGLSLATKINAVFVPLLLVLWGVPVCGKKVLPNVVSGVLLGPCVFYLCWPWLWSHPIDRAAEFIDVFRHHPFDAAMYFGTAYSYPRMPWHYPFVMTVLTLPMTALVGGLAGTVRVIKHPRADAFAGLLGALSLMPMLLIVILRTPVMDGLRFFLSSLPFIAMLSAVGLAALVRLGPIRRTVWSSRTRRYVMLALLLTACSVGPAIYCPFFLSYYNELILGLPGAARAGMQITYWGEAFTPQTKARLRENLRPGMRVHFLCVQQVDLGPGVNVSTSPFREVPLVSLGRIKVAYQDYDPRRAEYDFIVINNRRGYFNNAIRALYDGADARYELFDEVRLLNVSLLKVFRHRSLLTNPSSARERRASDPSLALRAQTSGAESRTGFSTAGRKVREEA